MRLNAATAIAKIAAPTRARPGAVMCVPNLKASEVRSRQASKATAISPTGSSA
jgi:hypothetical protein